MQQKEKDNRRLKTFLKRAKSKKRTKVGLRVRPAMLVALKRNDFAKKNAHAFLGLKERLIL